MVYLWVCGCVLCSALQVPFRDFPGDPEVKTPCSQCMVWEHGLRTMHGLVLIPDQGTRSHVLQLQPRAATHTHTHTQKTSSFKKCPPDPSSWINSSLALMPNITSFFEDLLSPNLEIISPAAALSLH